MNDFSTSGLVTEVFPIESGQKTDGSRWKRQEFVILPPGEYGRPIFMTITGDKVETINIRKGEDVTVKFKIESRKIGNKYFTDARAWDVRRNGVSHNTVKKNDDIDSRLDNLGFDE